MPYIDQGYVDEESDTMGKIINFMDKFKQKKTEEKEEKEEKAD